MASVTLDNVSKTYGLNVQALQPTSLEVFDKEFLVLVGPSGCGKTTILRLISGLEELSSGKIFIDGLRVNHVAPKDRDIAMVFQNYALYPHMNVYENMSFGLKLRKTPKPEIERRVNDASKLLGLENLLTRKPRELSGGQRQRVAMGRAIVRNPKVFLMDEPLSNLDAQLRIQMRVELQKLHHRLGVTTIYVTHDQTEAMTLGSRIVVMNDGIIQQIDTPIRIYEKPANLFVAGFIGSPPMNFMDSTDHGKNVVLGIRPEDLAINPSPAPTERSVEGVVEAVEHLGNEAYAHCKFFGDCPSVDCPQKIYNWIAKMDPRAHLEPNSRITVTFEPARVHLFDPQTGKRLGREG